MHASTSRPWPPCRRPPPVTTATGCCRAWCSQRSAPRPRGRPRRLVARRARPRCRAHARNAGVGNAPSRASSPPIRCSPPCCSTARAPSRRATRSCGEARSSTAPRSVAAAPLELGSSRLGALAAIHADGRPFTQGDLDLLALAASTLALTLVAIAGREDRERSFERETLLVSTMAGSAMARRRPARARAGRRRSTAHRILTPRRDPAGRADRDAAGRDRRSALADHARPERGAARTAARRLRARSALPRRAVPASLASGAAR